MHRHFGLVGRSGSARSLGTRSVAQSCALALSVGMLACGSAGDVTPPLSGQAGATADAEPVTADDVHDAQGAQDAQDEATANSTATPPADFDAPRPVSGSQMPAKRALGPLVARTSSTSQGLTPEARAQLLKVGRIEHRFSNGRVVQFVNSDAGNFGTGDLLLGKTEGLPAFIEGVEFQTRSLTTDDDDDLWPNNVVPFEIDSAITGSNRTAITDAVALWNQDSPIVRWRPASGSEDRVRFVKVQTDEYCGRSPVGKSFSWWGPQEIEIDADCFQPGIVVHEMGHATGLHHEQQRCGRNAFVSIHNSTVTGESPRGTDYDELCGDSRNSGDYDYGSIMHYGPNEFLSTVGFPIGSFLGLQANAGQRVRLSQNDVNGINELYFKKVFSTTSASAFAWAQQSSGSFEAASGWAMNSAVSTGSRAVITRLSTGRYRVDYPKVGKEIGGNVQVTAYGSDPNRCKVESWLSSGETLQVTVRCSTPAGALADGLFTTSYKRLPSPTGVKGGYLYSNRIDAAGAYTPDPWYQWNSAGKTNRVIRRDVGRYDVDFPGVSISGGTVRLTAFGPNNDYCTIGAWSSSRVQVNCFAPNGAAKDSAFSVAFTDGAFTGSYGYAWANAPTTARYAPSSSYQKAQIVGLSTPVAASVMVNRNGTGDYLVEIPGVAPFASNVSVSAYASNNSCKVAGWGAGASVGPNLTDRRENVSVRCFNASGAPADSLFAITYMTNELVIP